MAGPAFGDHMLIKQVVVENYPNNAVLDFFECDGCGRRFLENEPHGDREDEGRDIHFCAECSFRLGLCSAKTFASCCGVPSGRAFIDRSGEIYIEIKRDRPKKPKLKKSAHISKKMRFYIFARDNFTCQYCRSTQKELHVDHIKPVSRGGDNSEKNLITACADCNLGKLDFDYELTLDQIKGNPNG